LPSAVLAILLGCYGFFLVNKIDLTTTDLGRHLKNGEVAINSVLNDSKTFDQLLKSNFYSYTEVDHSFINHHFGSGMIFYLVEKFFGFQGLSLFFIITSLITFALFFELARKNSNIIIASLTALLFIPLIAERKEIRPEIFSYLFIAVFFWILWHYRKKLISRHWLFILPIIGIIWVNLHIYFIFGLFLIGVILTEEILDRTSKNKEKVKDLFSVFILTALGFLAQPNGIKGILYPFNIFKEYGYRVVENQSIWFLEKIGIINNPNLLLFKITFSFLILSFIFLFFLNRKEFSLNFFILGTTFGIMAALALRNFTLFGLMALVILSYNLKKILEKTNFHPEFNKAITIVLFLIIVGFNLVNNQQNIKDENKGLGLSFNNNASAEFFTKQNIKGPIFNNYDIGSYLIYNFFPKEKVFTDNRPEAYTNAFFQEIYIPMQEDEKKWEEQDKKYGFNSIFFSHRDYTSWGQKFLIDRINDEKWAPVFVDQYAIIFLKRNDLNEDIIEKYEIPKNFFKEISA